MDRWPKIEDEKTHARLTMDDDSFAGLAARVASSIGLREFAEADLERAIGYPWQRGHNSFLLRDQIAGPIEPAEAALLTSSSPQRIPLIAFGANAAAKPLAQKLSALPDNEREVPVFAGYLQDYALGFSPHLTIYGSLPATLLARAGERLRTSLLLVTEAQFRVLTWTEFNYLLAAIPAGSFEPDLPIKIPQPIYAYVSRHGALAIDGDVPTMSLAEEGQAAGASSQIEALRFAARTVLGDDATEREIVKRTIEDYSWAVEYAAPRLLTSAAPLSREQWQIYPQE